MKIRKIISLALSAAMLMSAGITAFAAPDTEKTDDTELYSETFDMTDVKPRGEDGVVFEHELENGDYTVTVTTGGKTETNANIYINGGERVRAYTLEAGSTQENPQPVVITDGKLSVQVLGENPNVTEIKIEQIPERTEPGEKPTIFVAGDSTAQTYVYENVYPQTGWGQVFSEQFTDDVIVENRSMGGRSSKSYNNDGRLDRILTEMKPGDYIFIQFGINDGAENKPERYISVEDYKKLIADKYIGETEKRGGIPVLMTATAAAWWDEENNNFMESRQDYADPTRDLAKELGCKFIDANRIITDEWNSMNKDDVLSGYFICEPLESKAYPTGTNDTTHLKAKGARRIASLIADAIPENVPELAKYLKPEEAFTDIDGHWAKDTIERLAADGVIEGDGSGKFNPDGTVTRAEFLKMVMEATGVPGHAYREGECLDAKQDNWYCYYVQSALDKGIIPAHMIGPGGYGKETKTLAEATEDTEAVTTEIYKFHPQLISDASAPGEPLEAFPSAFDGDKPITREEMAALLFDVYWFATVTSKDRFASVCSIPENVFTDEDEIDPAYKVSVISAEVYDLVSGMGDGTFAPKAELTRAQAATVIGGLLP